MRYLILSDIHGNDEAFSAVVQRLRRKRFDRVVCLGDFVGYGADPNKVLDRFRKLSRPTISIRGNHDKVASGLDSGEAFNQSALQAVRWTQEKLSKENAEFLKRLPAGPAVVDGLFAVCHGSPLDEDSYIFSDLDASMNFLFLSRFAPQVRFCFFGHSHIPSIFTLEANRIKVEAVSESRRRLVLAKGKRYLINPGSVGQPRDHDPRASYAIFDSEKSTVVFDRVRFDVDRTRRKIIRAGLPAVLGNRLVAGL